jgi:ParB family chromosome partitioning protein
MDKLKKIQMIPVDKIHILNPRNRDAKKFAQIQASIRNLGLKRPIVVSLRSELRDDSEYDLVCGQGRLESVIAQGGALIPAIIMDISREERLLGSLVENCARRLPRMHEMSRPIAQLRDAGYTNTEIARKTDMDDSTISCILNLFDNGEARLLQAVEMGTIPISVAFIIATVPDHEAQNALADAYEHHGLRGKALMQARRIVEQRQTIGKQLDPKHGRKAKPLSSEGIVKEVEMESKRQQLAIKKASLCDKRLVFAITAFKKLLSDENFRNLLRAEKLETMPAYLSERMEAM